MTPHHEMLLGISREDLPHWQSTLDRWKNQFHHARLKVVPSDPKIDYPNPKIAWNKTLAPHASGMLWLWSDLDISVPAHYLETLLREYQLSPKSYVTNAYVVSTIDHPSSLLDALFVNAEFLPGVLGLDQIGKMKTAFGAGILFSPEIFSAPQRWDHLGFSIADDYELAHFFSGGTLSRIQVQTTSQTFSFPDSFHHYRRWHKTVRWCDPLGYAGLILLLPMISALGASLLNPLYLKFLGIFWGMEVLIGYSILRITAPQIRSSSLVYLLIWPWIRPFVWISSWFPNTVQWGRTTWDRPDLR
jgi:hypothetical protein